MKTVKQLLDEKGRDVWTVTPDSTVFDALKLMADKNIGAVVVTDAKGICGIMSERDYARKVVLHGRSSRTTPVSEIMTERVLVVRPDQTVQECMALMTRKRLRHLPVVEDGELVGIISIGDVVKAILSEQEFMIDQLETYIMGHRITQT
ncbi:MAG: CBS domain-containing protein [Chloroflexi bacterium]|nr:CBS domain-containing protein [Chloroflexota bacterium]